MLDRKILSTGAILLPMYLINFISVQMNVLYDGFGLTDCEDPHL